MYTGIVLSGSSRSALKALLEQSCFTCEGYDFFTPHYLLPHHMTINLGSLDLNLNNSDILNKEAELIVDAFFFDIKPGSGICAARVVKVWVAGDSSKEIKSSNQNPHITMCLEKGVKPFMSNKLNWQGERINIAPVILTGIVQECQ